MKLYLLTQNLNNNYDTYDSCVVAAENEADARTIHPSEFVTHYKDNKWFGTYSTKNGDEYETENGHYSSWVEFTDIDKIQVTYIGESDKLIKRGVIISSFNAG